ncbi:hypothetical protein TSUD_315960 [Trifolium subterraneum]|uniref:Uncharacterized protein n=1 Tax=Trifolium subterraneum TaxID=3900 RepID=A0A2Z6MHC0_TRISU|nr:hypothetical protein TSUD_315960 [Trifolium subterraneum]
MGGGGGVIGGLLNLLVHWNLDKVHLKKILKMKRRMRIMNSLLMSLKIKPMRRINIVGEALQGREIGIEDVIVIDTGDRFLCTDSMQLRSIMGQTVMLHWDRDYDRDCDRECGRGRDRDMDRDRDREKERDKDRERDRDRYRLREEKDYGREREGREPERRDRVRDRGRRRSYSRSRSRSRDRKEHDGGESRKRHARSSISPRRHGDEDGEPKKMN